MIRTSFSSRRDDRGNARPRGLRRDGPRRRGSRSWSPSARKSCASATSSRMPAWPPTCRCSARRISARPAPCQSRASPRRCAPTTHRARHRRAQRGGGDAAIRALTAKDITDRIARAFAGQYGFGDAQNLAVILDRDIRILHVEPTVTADLVVARMNVEPRTGRFDIAFELPGSTLSRRAALRFTGTVTETVEAAT